MSVFRILGLGLATTLTLATMTGITALVASDFGDLGEGLNSLRQVFSQSAPEQQSFVSKDSALNGADNISFFKSVPIEGTSFMVTTGIAFASVEDVVAGKSKNRWCYIRHQYENVNRQIDLGKQEGDGKPKYHDPTRLPDSELRLLGLSATRLAELARSHCFLGGFDPRQITEPETKRLLPPRVWKLPRIWRSQPGRKPSQRASIPNSLAPIFRSKIPIDLSAFPISGDAIFGAPVVASVEFDAFDLRTNDENQEQ